MTDALRKTLWFVGLWFGGVGTVTAIGLIIRTFLN